jgi:prepilin-type N-terminal cleavage/methylation domain-containing protein
MRRSRGFSLMETIVAVALLAVIVVSILSAFSATALAATRHQQQTSLDRLARSDAEYVKSQAYQVKPANYLKLAAAGYAFAYQFLYYDPVGKTFATTNAENGLQEVVLTVTGPNGATETLYFLKVRS